MVVLSHFALLNGGLNWCKVKTQFRILISAACKLLPMDEL